MEGCTTGQVLHGSATTTEAVRRAVQHSQEEPEGSGQALRDQPEDRGEVEEAVVGRRCADRAQGGHSTVLSLEDEAVVVAFRKHTLLPLDDCLYALQPARQSWCRIR